MSNPAVNALSERVDRLEELLEKERRRTARGYANQRVAAAYLGKSREWLRQLERRGEGPRRSPDGTYSYDELDLFKERNPG